VIKTLSKQIKEYKGASIGTPLCMLLEVAMEMIIPLLMASIIDKGVNAGDMGHIYKIGAYMLCAAALGLFAGLLGARLGAKASAGFAKKPAHRHVRQHTDLFLCQYRQILHGGTGDQTHHRRIQSAERLPDDIADVRKGPHKHGGGNDNGVYHQRQTGQRVSYSRGAA
jgi:ABC-type multidrug transport system fused ATPase/permease subunit